MLFTNLIINKESEGGKYIVYKVIERQIAIEGEKKTVYGLRHEDGTVIEDVSGNKKEVDRMAEWFSEMELSSYQLNDVLTDIVDTPNGYKM